MNDGVNIVRQADLSPLHDEGIIIYSHPLLQKQLGRVLKVCDDATFSSSPKLFSQLWIIYGLVGDAAWVPLIYANMPNKQNMPWSWGWPSTWTWTSIQKVVC